MQITSPSFAHNEVIPTLYTCQGEDISPPLQFSDIPANAISLALIVDDPDAPNHDWVHWLIWNIPPTTVEIPENISKNFGVQGITSFGRSGYGGPCPPSGQHRYFFKLYALDTTLELSNNATKNDLLKALEGHIIAQSQLIGLYQKQ